MSTTDRPDSDRVTSTDSRKVIHVAARTKRRRASSTAMAGPQSPRKEQLVITQVTPDTVSVPTGAQPTAGSAMLEELRATGFIGMWGARDEMQDSTVFAQQLCERIQVRADHNGPAE